MTSPAKPEVQPTAREVAENAVSELNALVSAGRNPDVVDIFTAAIEARDAALREVHAREVAELRAKLEEVVIALARLKSFADYMGDQLNEMDVVEPEDEDREAGCMVAAHEVIIRHAGNCPACPHAFHADMQCSVCGAFDDTTCVGTKRRALGGKVEP